MGRTKSDKSLIPMWAAPAAERCFEYINDISYLEHDYQNTFHELIDDDITIQSMNISMVICVLGDNSSCLLWANATILDRQSLVSSTTQDVEIHLLKMKMHQRTRLTTLKDVHPNTNNTKRQTVFALS